MTALLPENETLRLSVLRRYGILDTAPEPGFDRITRLVSALFQVPMALISFVDQDRQWFKSHYGLQVEQTERSISFCSHAIMQSDVLLVPDATQDERFASSPLVTSDPFIHFYAGAPLITHEGAAVGTVCIMDRQPRQDFTAEKKRLLQDFANLVLDQLEHRLSTGRIDAALKEVARISRLQKAILNSPQHAVISTSSDGMIQSWNAGAERLFGYTASEAIGRDIAMLVHDPDELRARAEEISASFGRGIEPNFSVVVAKVTLQSTEDEREWVYLRKNGERFPALLSVTALTNDSGGLYGYLALAHDLSKQRGVEQQLRETVLSLEKIQAELRTSLEEKEMLLKEVHHRVKNNLQVISSLISMQSAHVTDKAAQEMFQESRSRVLSMAAIHEHLYRAADLSRVNMQPYLRQVIANLFASYGSSRSVQLKMSTDPEPLLLSADQAIPVGLIVNELVSNSLKYAFHNRIGEICVRIQNENGIIRLMVRDNGAGLPVGFTFPGTSSLGLRLVDTLIHRQLQGKLDICPGPGTCFKISFPLESV